MTVRVRRSEEGGKGGKRTSAVDILQVATEDLEQAQTGRSTHELPQAPLARVEAESLLLADKVADAEAQMSCLVRVWRQTAHRAMFFFCDLFHWDL